MSKRPDFTPSEVELLRSYARELQTSRKLTGEKLGALMGVKQQNASAFIKPGSVGGIGRLAANALARSENFRDAEQLLLVLKGVAAATEVSVGNVWSERDAARKVAEAMGVAAPAIDAVIAQRKAPSDARRPVKWWVFQFVQQELQMAADGEVRS